MVVYDEPVDTSASQVQSVLTFDPVKYTDTGKYTCQSSNHPEFYVEATTSLIVECKNFKFHNLYLAMYISHIIQMLQ